MLPKVIFLFVIGFILLDAVSCQDALVKSYPGKKKIRDNSCYSSCTECFSFFSTFGRPPLFYDDDGFRGPPIEDGDFEVNTRNHYEPLVENFIGEMSCLGFCTCYFLNDINALPDSFYGSRVTNPVETCFDSYVQFMERVIYFDYPQFYGIFYNYIFNGFDAMEYYYSDLISEASQEFRERCISDCTDVNVHHQAYTCEDIHIQVDGNPIIAEDSLTVQLDIRHECYRHLNAILFSPSGEKLNLFNFATGNVEVDTCGKDRDLSFELGNNENDDCQAWGSYYFTADTSEDNPELGWGSYTDGSRFGPSVPSYFGESLNDFAQESVEGTWSLCIGDLFNDSGMILEQVLEQMCCNEFFYEFGYYEQRSSDNYYQLLQLNNDNDFHWAIGEAGDAYSEPIVVDSNDITAFTDEMIFEVGVSFTKNSGDVTVELVLNNDSFEDYPILEFVLSTENGDQRNGPIFAEAFSFFDENTELFADFAGEYSLKVTHGVTDFGEIYEWTLDIAYISRLPQVCGDIFQDYEYGFLCFDFGGDDEYFPYEEFPYEVFPNENNFKRDLPGSKSSANTHAIREIFSSMDEERRNRAINEIQQFTTRTAGISGDTFIGDGNSQFQGDFSWSLHWVPNDEDTTLVEEDIIVVAGLTTPPRFVEEITLRYVDTYLNNFIGFTDNNNEGLPPRYYNGYYASHYSDDNNNDDDYSTFTTIIEIDETFDIEQVAVAVDFYHYRNLGSLFISLTSPEGTTVQIYNGDTYDFRCDNDNYLETIFSDFGTNPFNLYNSDDDTACNNNIIQSFQPLSAFVGEDPDGDWILTVTENDDDVGSYVFDWDLLFNWEPTIYTDYDDDDFSVDFYYNNMEFYGHVKNPFGRAIMEEFLFSRINFASNYPNFGGWANSNYVSLRNTMETGYSDFEDTISTQTPGDIFAKKIVTVDFYPLFFQDFFNLSQLENHLQTEMADEFPGESWDSVFTDYNYGYIFTDDDDTTDLDRNPLGYDEVYYSEDYYKYYVYFSPNQQNSRISGVNIENEQNKESYEEYSDFIGFKKYADSIELFFLSTYDLLYTDVYPVQMQYTFQPFLGNLDEITSRTEYRFLQVQSFFYFMEDHYQRDQKSIYYQKNAFLPSPTQVELQLVPRPNYGDDDDFDGFYYYCNYNGGIFYDPYCYNVDEDKDRYPANYYNYGPEFLGERTTWDRFFPDPFFPFSPSGYDPSERYADYLFDDNDYEFFLRNLIEDSVLTTIPTGNLIGSSFNIGFDGNWPINDFASRNSDDYPHGPLLFSPDEAFYPLFDVDSAFLFSEAIAVTRKDNFESYNYYFPLFTPDSSFISTFAYQERSYYNGETLTGKLIVQNDGSIPSDFSDNQNYFKKYFNNYFNQFHERFEEPSTTSKFPPSLNRQGSHMLNLVEWLLESCEDNIFTGGEDFDLDPLCVRSSKSKASIPINDIFSVKSQCQLSVQNCFSQLCDINDLNEDGSCSSNEFRILNNVCQTNFRNVVFSAQDPNKFKPRNSERTLVQTITVEAGGLCFNDGRKSSCDNFQNILPINLERTFVIYSENDVPEDECYQPCGNRCNMQLVE